ncbi:MAG: tetratricopeptide repeat protein [Cyclobacteriaceae bacterium]|nr:tetratricopeptide repeat protein [Cyclobacteriaceae bacterium]
MNKYPFILIIGGLLSVFLLYRLPTVVVENETDSSVETHDFSISLEDGTAMASLKGFLASDDSKNSFNFADSLAGYFLKYGFLDSAIAVSARYLEKDRSLEALKRAAAIRYTIFERSSTAEEAQTRAREAGALLTSLLEAEPENPSVKAQLAMTLVSSESPMAGITLLREVEASHPNHRETLINLGLLSIQSGQYDKGIERFTKLLTLDSVDYEAMLYLGICLHESGQKEEALLIYEKLSQAEGADPALKAAAKQYLFEE